MSAPLPPKPPRRFQFSLRTFLLFALGSSVVFGWIGIGLRKWLREAEVQAYRESAWSAEIRDGSGAVIFVYAWDSHSRNLYGVMWYGKTDRPMYMRLAPTEGVLTVNGVAIGVPPTDGYVYAVDRQLRLHKSPVTVDQLRGPLPLDKDPVWRMTLQPFVRQYHWDDAPGVPASKLPQSPSPAKMTGGR